MYLKFSIASYVLPIRADHRIRTAYMRAIEAGQGGSLAHFEVIREP